MYVDRLTQKRRMNSIEVYSGNNEDVFMYKKHVTVREHWVRLRTGKNVKDLPHLHQRISENSWATLKLF
jgi:hypothetical protein